MLKIYNLLQLIKPVRNLYHERFKFLLFSVNPL
jgi:hypothetical protein